MKDVKYIAESQEFIVDGQVIKETSLTTEERKKLMKECKNVQMITGDVPSTENVII